MNGRLFRFANSVTKMAAYRSLLGKSHWDSVCGEWSMLLIVLCG